MLKAKKTPISAVERLDDQLRFSGKLDHQGVPILLETFKNLMANDPLAIKLAFDIRDVSKLDSAGLAMFIHWRNQYLKQDEQLLLKGASKKNKQLIQIMGLSDFFA